MSGVAVTGIVAMRCVCLVGSIIHGHCMSSMDVPFMLVRLAVQTQPICQAMGSRVHKNSRYPWKRTVVFVCPDCHTEKLKSVSGVSKTQVMARHIGNARCSLRGIHKSEKSVVMDRLCQMLFRDGIRQPLKSESDSDSD